MLVQKHRKTNYSVYINRKAMSIRTTSISIRNIGGKTLNVLFLLVGGLLLSQKYPLRFGIKGGWNYSNVDAVDSEGELSGYRSDIIDELYGGLVLEKQITSRSYIQSGLLISFTSEITFLELPIFYKYQFYKNFSVIGGPKIEYIPDEQYNWGFYFRNRFGVSANLGIDYKISKKFTAEAYYSRGLVKQYDDLMLEYYDSKRNVYRVGITYFF